MGIDAGILVDNDGAGSGGFMCAMYGVIPAGLMLPCLGSARAYGRPNAGCLLVVGVRKAGMRGTWWCGGGSRGVTERVNVGVVVRNEDSGGVGVHVGGGVEVVVGLHLGVLAAVGFLLGVGVQGVDGIEDGVSKFAEHVQVGVGGSLFSVCDGLGVVDGSGPGMSEALGKDVNASVT